MPRRRIAFFGATGDCAGYCLANSLKDGGDCVALARTPAKLTSSLKAKGVSETVLDEHLTIVQGDIKDVEAVKKTLALDGHMVDGLVSGIGGTPALQWSLFQPVILSDMTICQDAGKTILRALDELKPATKPVLINVSTTGLTPPGAPSDVPWLLRPLYHWILSAPHADKKVMEDTLADNMKRDDAPLAYYVNIKPSLLTDGPSIGLDQVRVGVLDKPAVGYTIRRADVGLWMFEKLLKADVPSEWRNNGISVTY